MKYKEVMTHILMPSWIKYHDEKDIRIVRKVYSIGDLRYTNEYDLFPSDMSKTPLEKIKRRLPSSSNLTMNNNNTILTSTLGKLLVRKLTHRSTTNMTKSTNDLNSNSEREDLSIGEKNVIPKDNLQFIEQIGEGQFGTVFKALYRTKRNEVLTVAMKKFNQNGISIQWDVKHPHIIQFYGTAIHADQSIMLVTEYASLKSLYHCLISTNSKREYSIPILLEFLKQITSAMSYLEKKSIIHKNLSCRNYLVFNKSLIKLSDWCSSSSPIPWMSPEVIDFQRYTTASDVFSFGVSMWECFSYGENPWKDQIGNAIDSSNHQRLSRPPYATSELYQTMLLCWKYEPSERPTFSLLEKTLSDIELKQVRWKDHNKSVNISDGFLPIESCLLGPLIILDRCLHIPKSSNIIQCVSIDGQIGFIDNENVEPLHVISLTKPSPMNSIFHRKTGIKRNSTKTKTRQLSKDMISAPQADLVHAFHVGVTGDSFGDITTCLNHVESTEQKPKEEQLPSLLDEVMQAFTEICPETERNADIDTTSRFTRELEERSQNGNLSVQGKHAYDLLINRCVSNSSVSSSSNPEKSDCRSHYSSISSLNSRSSSINKPSSQPSVTGQPLPPPPDLSSLGSKLTIATMTETFQLPKSLTLNKYRTKKRFHLFA